jgi:hypothetical protein
MSLRYLFARGIYDQQLCKIASCVQKDEKRTSTKMSAKVNWRRNSERFVLATRIGGHKEASHTIIVAFSTFVDFFISSAFFSVKAAKRALINFACRQKKLCRQSSGWSVMRKIDFRLLYTPNQKSKFPIQSREACGYF